MLLTVVPIANGIITMGRLAVLLLVGNVLGIGQIVPYLNARILTTTIIMVRVLVVLVALVAIVRRFVVLRAVSQVQKSNTGTAIVILTPIRVVTGISIIAIMMMAVLVGSGAIIIVAREAVLIRKPAI